MKKLLYIFATAVLAVSCNLDSEFYSESKKNDYITGDAAVNNLVMGCYNAMQATKNAEWAITEVRTNNTRVYSSGSSSVTTRALEYIDQGKIPSTSTYVEDYWNSTYSAIYRSNEVLANLSKVGNDLKRAQYEGEVKFLRAMHYFNLVRLWGGVFLVTEPTSAVQARNMQRVSKGEIYDLILSDLNDIVDNSLLPETYPTAELGRVTMLAAKSMLAKVLVTVYQPGDAEYANAATLLNDVLVAVGNPVSAASLVPYNRIFATDNEMNAEIIFTVRYKAGNLGLGSPFGNWFAPVNNGAAVILGNAYSHNYPSDNVIMAYESGDLRKDISLKEGYYNNLGVWVGTGICRYVCKYLAPVSTNLDGESDWPVIRVADVALLAAEIENELNGTTSKAFTYLNMIRNRAGLGTLTSAELPSKYDFREAVRKERRMELAFENQWFFDLLRWGIAKTTINDFLANEPFYSTYTYPVTQINDWQVMLPIPQSVMNINPDIAQNMGY